MPESYENLIRPPSLLTDEQRAGPGPISSKAELWQRIRNLQRGASIVAFWHDFTATNTALFADAADPMPAP
jgi:hypothetical protein